MSSKITQLSNLPAITSSDYLVVARSSDNSNYKLLVNSVFASLTNIGHSTPLYLIDAISSSNVVTQRGLKSASPILTLTLDVVSSTKNISFDIVESEIDLSLCDNSNSGFLTSINVASATGVLPVANGGTGLSELIDKAVLITQDSGADALTAVSMTTSGSLLIGGASGPAVSTLTAGNNVTITNGDGSISIASSFTTATANVNMAGYNIDMDNGWLSYDGSAGGIAFAEDKIYIGDHTAEFYNSSVNIQDGITFVGGQTQIIEVLPTSVAGELKIFGPSTNGSNSNGGDTTITAGNASGSGTGGDLNLIAGGSSTGTGGAIKLETYVTGTLTTALTVAGTAKVSVNENDFEVVKTGKGIALPTANDTQVSSFTETVEINEVTGKITLYGGALSAGTQTQFTVVNSTVTATSRILLTVEGPGASLETDNSIILAHLAAVQNGQFDIVLTNIGGANTDTRSRKIHFLVIK